MRRKLKQNAAAFLVRLGLQEAYAGNAAWAAQRVADALAIDQGPERLIEAAHVLGISGGTARAAALAEEANHKVPSTDTMFHAIDLPLARAAIELGRRAPATALEALKPVAPYERGLFANSGLYLRGLA